MFGSIRLAAMIGNHGGWQITTLAKGAGKGTDFRAIQIGSNGQTTGVAIRYSPNFSGRHFNGRPYWTVSSPKGGKQQFPYGGRAE